MRSLRGQVQVEGPDRGLVFEIGALLPQKSGRRWMLEDLEDFECVSCMLKPRHRVRTGTWEAGVLVIVA